MSHSGEKAISLLAVRLNWFLYYQSNSVVAFLVQKQDRLISGTYGITLPSQTGLF